ncbi:HIG1 domain family member 2A, mitochondrial [Brachionichthys hirsutus]|uniref:HIG1 domain family member 2A, mitochondrial n=1 Tax=Brachionichthys hirsutus TaxID=412623 RepID=UPI00360506FC
MAASVAPAAPDRTSQTASPTQGAFNLSEPPVIDGFTASSKITNETSKEKFMRKTKENPFVPIGCLGTAGALIYGLRAFHQGRTRRSQLLMRTRIFAQGFTVVAIVVGVFATALRPKP